MTALLEVWPGRRGKGTLSASFIRPFIPLTSQRPQHLKLSHQELSFSEWILRDTNFQPKAVLHIECLEGAWCALSIQCMLTVNVTLLFLALPLSARLFWWEINSYFHLSSSCLDFTVPEARGVGWMGWHFSIINPLFSQLVKISQLTHKGTAYTFFCAGSGLSSDWPPAAWPDDCHGSVFCLLGTGCPIGWPTISCDKQRQMD